MKQIETDPNKLAGAEAVDAMRRAEAADTSQSDEDAFFRATRLRDEFAKRGDVRLSAYASREDGSPVRIFPSASGAILRQSDAVIYPFMATSIGGKMGIKLHPPVDGSDSGCNLIVSGGDYLRGMKVVNIVQPYRTDEYSEPPKSIADCPASADQRRPEPGITVHKGASCGPTEGYPTGSIEQGFIVELREGASTVRFKVSREAERDELESFGGWYIHEETGTVGSGDWSLMDSLGEFVTPGGAYRHLICNGYGIPLTGIDPIPNSGFNLAPGME